MSQYGQVKTSCAFQGCAKVVLWLHTARTENPDTPQTPPTRRPEINTFLVFTILCKKLTLVRITVTRKASKLKII